MTYLRVIPRDLFNEANLLKCYGQIYLNLERLNLPDVGFEHDDPWTPFDVRQDEDSGTIHIANVTLTVRGCACRLDRPLNSRQAWPLYLTTENEEEIAVFSEDGSFSPEMLTFLNNHRSNKAMKSVLTPFTAHGVTTEQCEVTFGPSGTPRRYTVTVPEGTACRHHGDCANNSRWLVADLSFIADERSAVYSDADIYGIPIPAEKIRVVGKITPPPVVVNDKPKIPLYVALARAIQSTDNCISSGNHGDAKQRHIARTRELIKRHMPSGAGVDKGTMLLIELTSEDKLVFEAAFHHTNDGGGYNGWTTHKIKVTPSLTCGFNVKVTGQDRADVNDYLHELYDTALRELVDEYPDAVITS